MKRIILAAVAALTLAVPAAASANADGYGNAGSEQAASVEACGYGAGAFGALGEFGYRHDLGQGDTSPTGSVKLGADGPATGLANSTLCGSR